MIIQTRLLLASLVFLVSATVWLPGAKAQSSDLSVTKVGPAQAAAGSDVTYTIDVFNNGPDDSDIATLRDPVPAGTTYKSGSLIVPNNMVAGGAPVLQQTSGPVWNCTAPNPGAPGTVVCTIDPLPVGSTSTFILKGHIPSNPNTSIYTNTASVTTSSGDPNSEND